MVNYSFLCLSLLLVAATAALPDGFTYLKDVDDSIVQEVRYYSTHNFLGRTFRSYNAAECILTKQAALGLKAVQAKLKSMSPPMSLKIYDCYRPQSAVDALVDWAQDLKDDKMKGEFYPTLNKDVLIPDYIASQSGHSRGSTMDLTIIAWPPGEQETYHDGDKLRPCFSPTEVRFKDNSIEMGTGFDCFHETAHTANPDIGEEAKQNRMFLKQLMEEQGFENYEFEWWHYTLKAEPFPNTYFDFPVDKKSAMILSAFISILVAFLC
eukprot:TRINITY_DN3772_c0_g3_i1.p1 TRINITY_DN3772_c0_g3~~TRINITY_DN3772_c0_g3_i1.p1  ORF type:complete len:266 (+),score=71.75 TRINITY_DN3772_c0_g3_i1:141-938(+)